MPHTPTPWHVFTTGPGPEGVTPLIAVPDGDGGSVKLAEVCQSYPNWRDNAEFIVRAANAHDDLVAACEEAAGRLRRFCDGFPRQEGDLVDILEKAIAKAKE